MKTEVEVVTYLRRVLGGGEDGHLHLPPLRQVDEQHQGGGGETQSENFFSYASSSTLYPCQ